LTLPQTYVNIKIWFENHTETGGRLVAKADFEWDEHKDRENQRKHGVSFALAQQAFLDPRRVIAKDTKHTKTEDRYYCIGKAGGGILTVRFTYRKSVIRIIGAGYWRKGKNLYEKANA
jgi:uncharacterized DUF497 family protein